MRTRIFHKCLGDMPQEARFQVTAAAIRVDNLSGGSLGHSIDGEVAAPQVLLQSDIRSELRGEASITQAYFALRASESVFLMALWMQKDRKFATNGHEPVALELFGARADNDPVALVHRTPEQTVPYRTANQVDFHTFHFTPRGAMRCAAFAGTALRLLLLATVMATLSGCYVMQAATGEWRVMRSRKPIDKVLADPNTAPSLHDTLQEVAAARNFASRELKLPDNRSYRTYADLHRPYVVWNVVAAPEFSVHPKQWCFPIAGCVAYRGYFSEKRARSFAADLAKRGFDITLDGVPAYSTLGKFADPVLSTMIRYVFVTFKKARSFLVSYESYIHIQSLLFNFDVFKLC